MENDLKMDTRENPENLYSVRMLIVRLHKQGMGPMAIKAKTGVSWGAVRKAIDLYAEGGAAALKPKTRGRKRGSDKRLTDEQEKDVRDAIRDKRPEQLKMEFALWTREAVMKYIEEHHGIRLPIRTVGDYLKRWGYTPQKPIKVAYEQKRRLLRNGLSRHIRRLPHVQRPKRPRFTGRTRPPS